MEVSVTVKIGELRVYATCERGDLLVMLGQVGNEALRLNAALIAQGKDVDAGSDTEHG
ncbi:MAG: hypothetical protein M3003_10535 [Candidatus Dormibacteraeota bacterium]|nr:hypothetical protein [Candidatus Dormibacteraeota bacterium]